MRVFTRVSIVRRGRYAEVYSYGNEDESDPSLKIRLVTQSGQIDIDAVDLYVLDKVIQCFKHDEVM